MSDLYPFHLIERNANPYGFSGIDRTAEIRGNDDWLKKIKSMSNTKVLASWKSKSMISEPVTGRPCVAFIEFSMLQETIESASSAVFLGQKEGKYYIGLDLSNFAEEDAKDYLPEGANYRDLREVGPILERFDACILAYNRAVLYWHQKNKYCGVCGSETRISKAGHQIDCVSPSCGQPFFPRTDPAVIMLVHDGDRVLLGRQRIWKAGMYSTLAGFLEPGESLEEAVAREVYEEANIEVGDVKYHSSQPWPFPASIMLGFYARARSTSIYRNDGEVEDVQWFTSEQLRNFENLEKSLPRTDSIARRLIEDWLSSQK